LHIWLLYQILKILVLTVYIWQLFASIRNYSPNIDPPWVPTLLRCIVRVANEHHFLDMRGNDVGEEANDEIDLVFVGDGQDNVGGFQPRLLQNLGIGARPRHDLHIKVIADPLERLRVDVDDTTPFCSWASHSAK
jgi:hypothetical protein